MYQGRDFQENDRPSFYSGRRIRRAVVEEPQSHQEGARPEETHGHEETQNHEEPRHRDTPARVRIQEAHEEPIRRVPRTDNHEVNDPKAKLVRSIESRLSGYAQTHLIGVFGMDSDNVVFEGLQEVTSNRNLIVLQKSRLIDDVFTMFSAAMYNFIETELNRGGSYRASRLSETWVKNQLFMYLQEIYSICGGRRLIF